MENIHKNTNLLLRKFYSSYSIETTPHLDKEIDSYKAILPISTPVMIASPNGSSLDEVVKTAKRLRFEEMEPVPHITARSIPDLAYLETLINKLQVEAEVDHLLVIAGDIPTPIGPYNSSMAILDLGILETRGIKKIGVSGHPEGSPNISDSELSEAIRWKNEYASRADIDVYICTQFVFEAFPVISWERKIRSLGNQLPIKVGVPGVATLQTLLRLAAACGVAQSVRFLKHQSPNIKKMIVSSTPEQLIKDLAMHCAQDPKNLIEGIHLFPFGGIKKTSQWITNQFSLNTKV